MKKFFKNLRDTMVAGLIFLLPVLILVVLVTKAFGFLAGLTTKLAGMFGLKSIMGISGGTLVSGILLLLVCLLCGYLMRMSFIKFINNWLDQKLIKMLPGYQAYREMARSKLEPRDEVLPYKTAAWITVQDNLQEPGFVLESLPGEKQLVFIPVAGNAREGKVIILPTEKVQLHPTLDMKAFQKAIQSQGVGILAQQKPI